MLELATHDRALRQRLLSQAQLSSAPAQEWRKAVSALLGRKRFMDYRDSIAYAKQLATLPALLEQARQRDPVAALDLHEYAFKRLTAIYEDCDDSGGHIGDRLQALAHTHPEFARSANVSNLAKRLFDLRMLDQWGLTPKLEVYVDLLGNAGIGALEHAALQALHDTASSRRAPDRLAADLLEETALRRQRGHDAGVVRQRLQQRLGLPGDGTPLHRTWPRTASNRMAGARRQSAPDRAAHPGTSGPSLQP